MADSADVPVPRPAPASPPTPTRHAPAGARPPGGQATVIVTLEGPVALDAIPSLCEEVRGQVQLRHAELVLCDVGTLARPDVVVIEALSRLRLTAQRAGASLELLHASRALRALLALVGLGEVLPCHTPTADHPHDDLLRVDSGPLSRGGR